MAINSLILSNNEIRNLKTIIKQNGLNNQNITSEYELLRVKDKNINLILYKTGKLVFNDTSETLNMLNSSLKLETGYDYFLGSDETGKGEWYGPLVVVATALKPEEIIKLRLMGVKDSKVIKPTKIIEIARQILETKIPYNSLILNPPTYNKLYIDFKKEGKNLNDLMAWAHSRVIGELLNRIEFNQAKVVIDRFDREKTEKRFKKLEDPRIKFIQKDRGESEIPVAAASILAKYLFKREVQKLDETYKINLKNSSPEEINPEILSDVAKEHFKNVKNYLRSD
jgi:ribonuclease HIII